MARLASRSKLTALAAALVIAYGAAATAWLLSWLEPVDSAEQSTIDWRFRTRGPVGEKPENIALVTIQEDADLPYWAPVPRRHLAEVVSSLAAGGARLIGLDIFLGKRSFDAEGDSLLAAAMEQAGNVVLVSYLEEEEGRWREHKALDYFQSKALDYGYASFPAAAGVEAVREGLGAVEVDGKHALSLAACLYAHYQGLDTATLRRRDWSQPSKELPGAGDDYRHIIDYNGPPYQHYQEQEEELPGGLTVMSSKWVPLVGRAPDGPFAGRIVLLGSGLLDAPDLYRTPYFSSRYNFHKTFGVEIHAQFLHTLLKSARLERSGFFLTAFLVLCPAFLAGLAAVRLRAHWVFLLTLFLVLLLWLWGFYTFVGAQRVIPLVTPTLAALFACLYGLVYVGSTDGKRKNEARERFAAVVGEQQLQEILEQPEVWAAEGEEQVVSALWLDLRQVEAKESMAGRETLMFYQDFWQQVSALVFKHAGSVLRYEDDSVLAVFGAPLVYKDHGAKALLAATDIAELWMALAPGRPKSSRSLHLGADSGRVFTGELAGGEHYAYRALGRPVENARRLALAQEGREQILVSQSLLDLAGDLAEVEAAGELNGEKAYRVVGRRNAPPLGAAQARLHPFWKYIRLDRKRDDPLAEPLLRDLALLADFNRRELRHLRPFLQPRSYRAGEYIFSQGEVGSAMYIIQRGAVDILQEGEEEDQAQLLQRLQSGDFFGELALLSDLPRPASAVAYEPTETVVLFQNGLYDLIEREPELGVRLTRTLSRVLGERLIQLNEELVSLQRQNAGAPR